MTCDSSPTTASKSSIHSNTYGLRFYYNYTRHSTSNMSLQQHPYSHKYQRQLIFTTNLTPVDKIRKFSALKSPGIGFGV